METSIKAAVARDGFTFIAAHMPDAPTVDAASEIGTLVQISGVDAVQVLRPRRREEAPPNLYSGNFGHDPFPLHTDLSHWFLPPRYLVLRCVEGTNAVTTRLLEGTLLVQQFGDVNLRRALVRPRRPISRISGLLRLLEQDSFRVPRLRWDALFLVPASAGSSYLCSSIRAYLAKAPTADFTLRFPGDTLIIDNWRMLHGRSAVPEADAGRIIHRAYLGALQ